MTILLERPDATETIELEPLVGLDDQGKPSYQQSPYSIPARVAREDHAITRPDGSTVQTKYSVWIDGKVDPLPLWHDRLTVNTLGEFRTLIVEERLEHKRLNRELAVVECWCREE